MANISIGPIGKPYFDALNNRTKALINCSCENVSQVEIILKQIIIEARGSRVSVRIFADHNVSVGELEQLEVSGPEMTLKLEAILPCHNADQLVVAYYGANSSDRINNQETLAQQQLLLLQAYNHAGVHQINDCYRIKFSRGSNCWSVKDFQDALAIYAQTYNSYLVDFTLETVAKMFKENWVAAYVFRGQIVSLGVAEIAEVRIGQNILTMSEISEVATHPNHRGQGLAKGIYRQLASELKTAGINLIFSETRANHVAILATALSAGFKPQGLLNQHCVLTSPFTEVRQSSTYADLVPFYLP